MDKRYFGKLLRKYRNQTRDPHSGKPLGQFELGESLETVANLAARSASQISYWENGQRGLPDRTETLGLIQVLVRYGGMDDAEDANSLLKSAGYARLDSAETNQLNFNTTQTTTPPQEEQPMRSQNRGGNITITGDGNILGDNNSVTKTETNYYGQASVYNRATFLMALQDLRREVEGLRLAVEDSAEIVADLLIAEKQAQLTAPSTRRLTKRLTGVRDTLQEVGTTQEAQVLVGMTQQLIAAVGQLF